MINFVLNKENLIERELSPMLIIGETFDSYLIRGCINLFNNEIQWDGMFTLWDALRRIEDGEKIFVGLYNGEIFGYCWVINKDDTTYIYNVFSKSTPDKRKYGATDLLYYVIKHHGNTVISAEVDEWNTKSIRVFEKLGFKVID